MLEFCEVAESYFDSDLKPNAQFLALSRALRCVWDWAGLSVLQGLNFDLFLCCKCLKTEEEPPFVVFGCAKLKTCF